MRTPKFAHALTALLAAFVFAALSLAANASEEKVFKHKLKNGMEVVVIPDRRAPVVTHMVWYKVGSADEPFGKSGIAHFLEHLMFKGTKTVPAGEFSKTVRRNGGRDNAFTSVDYTAYFQRISKDRIELVMKLEADRMVNLTLRDEDVLPERDVVLEERRSRIDNDPSSRLSEQVNAALYLAHPYRKPVIGWPTEVSKLTREDALSFYKRYYTPENAILIVAGDVSPEDILPLAEKYYGSIPPNGEFIPRKRTVEPLAQAERVVVLKDPRVTSPSLRRAYVVASYATDDQEEAAALDVLAHILGSGTTSRLYRKLVVEQRKASYAGAYYRGDALDTGTLAVYGAPQPGSGRKELKELEVAVDEVLADLITNGVTDQEVRDAQDAMISQTIYALDSQTRRARIFGVAMTTGQTVEDVLAWPERIEAVTKERVKAAAEKYLLRERSVTGLLLKEEEAAPEAKEEKSEQKS
ncbi:MAG: M16 family metallopeptidase [Hyphomicrobiales bacterium]